MALRFLTAGESHGKTLLGILEGVPAGLEITAGYIDAELKRRKLGYGRGARQKIESDRVEILAGIRHGKSLGSPIGLAIANQDFKNWQEIMQPEPFSGDVARRVDVPRPGHADLAGALKYGHSQDMRNVLERASARETTMRVALASVARKLLEDFGVFIASRVIRIGAVLDDSPLGLPIPELNAAADASPVRCPSPKPQSQMIAAIEAAKKEGDSLGGVFEVYACDPPVGLGSYVHWDRRFEGRLAQAFMSLNAVKGVEIGLGFASGAAPGSRVHDAYRWDAERARVLYESNRSGGIDGGMTTGQPLVVRAVMKPLATLMQPLRSVNLATHEDAAAHIERSDVCSVPAAAVIGESLLALELCAALLEKFGGDSMPELRGRVQEWRAKRL